MRHTGRTLTGDFQLRYSTYARDHGMTEEQMLAFDKKRYPDALLTPYLLWVSRKWFEWGKLHPGRRLYSRLEEASFAYWLTQLLPGSDALTCECHLTTATANECALSGTNWKRSKHGS
jgi:hypothetical protein